MESKRNKKGDLVVTMSENERFNDCKALETVCDILYNLELSPLNDEQRRALSELAEIIDVDTQKRVKKHIKTSRADSRQQIKYFEL